MFALELKPSTKAALLRFVKGFLASVTAAGIAYGIEHVGDLSGVLPPLVMSLFTALLLALQKWLKEKGYIPMP